MKNRNAVAAGILAVALVVGGFALYSTRTAQKAPEQTAQTEIDEPSTPASGNPDDTGTTETTATGEHKATETPAATTDSKTTDSKTTGSKTTDTGSTTGKTTVPDTYTVQKGDTLRDIAKRYYGDPVYSGDIERVNNLPNANNIPVGKVLTMPRPDELNSAPTTGTKAEKTPEKPDTTPTN